MADLDSDARGILASGSLHPHAGIFCRNRTGVSGSFYFTDQYKGMAYIPYGLSAFCGPFGIRKTGGQSDHKTISNTSMASCGGFDYGLLPVAVLHLLWKGCP